jgi:SAM-dependent methyltransferase
VSDDWSDGYVTDFDYTWGFFRELSPAWLSWVAGLHGHRVRAPGEPFTYMELGCGNGLSANAFAAAYPEGSFWACDFNPNHVANARELAARAGSRNVEFLEKSFAELESANLPEFDFITFHGVLSWISEANRRHIIQFLRSKLKPGGVCYASYNALPGWSALEPVRRMMLEYASTVPGDTHTKVTAAIAWLGRLREANAKPIAENPRVQRLVDRITKADPAYVAHEYFNKDWELFYFQDVVREFGAAKLTWAGSANLVDNEEGLRVGRAGTDLLRGVNDPLVREQSRDFLQSPTFRKDVFVKGSPRAEWARDPHLNPGLLKLAIGNGRATNRLAAEVKMPAGTVRFKNEFDPVLYSLFDRGSRSLGEIFEPMQRVGRSPAQTLASVRVFVATDQLRPCARAYPVTAAASGFAPLSPFNQMAVEDAVTEGNARVLCSPSHGTGVLFTVREGCLLDAIAAVGADRAVEHATQRLRAAGRRLVVDGVALDGDAAHRAALLEEFQAFRGRKIDRFLRLGVLVPA